MKKVLLIEDDTVLRENTAEILELSNYKVITASNGTQGVALAKSIFPDIQFDSSIEAELRSIFGKRLKKLNPSL